MTLRRTYCAVGVFVAALLLYLIYSNAVHAGLIVMEQRDTMQGSGLWPVHAALAALVLVLMWRYRRHW